MSIKKHILITGSNRSGSTWVGKVVAAHGKVDTIIEPFNLNRIKRFKRIDLDCWYPKVDASSPVELKSNLGKLVTYYLGANYRTFFSLVLEKYEGHSLIKSAKKRWRRASKPIKMLKDPTAIFAVPWLVDTFDVKPIILIRHPAAYVLSIKEKNWWFDFNNLLEQPNFFSGELESLGNEVAEFKKQEAEKDIIENAALMWKVFYTHVLHYQKEHPNWYFVTHEALSLNPTEEFKKMFAYLDLNFTEGVQDYIHKSTLSKKGASGKHQRNSAENARKWMSRLSSEEIKRIGEITIPVAEKFYNKFVEL